MGVQDLCRGGEGGNWIGRGGRVGESKLISSDEEGSAQGYEEGGEEELHDGGEAGVRVVG